MPKELPWTEKLSTSLMAHLVSRLSMYPPRPILQDSTFVTKFAIGVAVSGHFAYVSAGDLIVDVSDPSHLVEAGKLKLSGYAYGVAANGNYAYVANGWSVRRVRRS